MKRVLLIAVSFILVLIFNSAVTARDFLPSSLKSIKNPGIGVYLAPRETVIYIEDAKDSKPQELLYWNELGAALSSGSVSTRETFIAFLPRSNIALLTVLDESDDAYLVVYNQETGAQGWIKKSDSVKIMYWDEFIRKYGRENRMYFLYDVPDKYKLLYTAPEDTAQPIKSETNYLEEMECVYIRGNWMMVRAYNTFREVSIGWIRWRDTDGRIFVFPNLK